MAKKRKSKKAYLNDFQLNEEGKYEYRGTMHVLDESNISLKQVKTKVSIYALLIFACFVVSGFIKADGLMNAFYIVVPYVFGFFFDCLLTYKTFSFVLGKYPIRDYDFKATIMKYDTYLLVILILDIATIIGEVYYLIRFGIQYYVAGTIIFLVCIIGILLATGAYKQFAKELKWLENEKLSGKS